MGAFTLAGLLYLGAAIFVFPFAMRQRPSREIVRRSAARLSLAVVLGGAVGPVLLAAGLQRASGASASLLLNLELVFTTVLAHFVFKEFLGKRVVIGTMVVTIAGINLGWSTTPNLRWGAVFVAGACLCWSVDNCVTANLDALRPAHITLVKGAAAGSVNFIIGLAIGGRLSLWLAAGAIVIGGFGYGLSITLWVTGARDIGAARGQLVFAVAPFVGTVIAWSVFREAVLTKQVIALAMAAVGVSLVVGSDHEHLHVHEPQLHEHEHRHDDGHHDHVHGAIDGSLAAVGSHHHQHQHASQSHTHPHVPDLHHSHSQ